MLGTITIPTKTPSLQWKSTNLHIEDVPQFSTTTNKDLNPLNPKPPPWITQIGCKLKTTSCGPINLKRRNRIYLLRSMCLMFTMRLTCLPLDKIYSGKFYYLSSLLFSIPSCIPNDAL